MAVLFNGSVSFPAGVKESNVLSLAGRKFAGQILRIRVSMDEAGFPTGETTISISVSSDGGVTYRTATGTYINPAIWKGAGPHYWFLEYGFGPDELATHVKYSTIAPQAFTTQVIVETS